jgi:hypothetical protein
MAAAVIAAIDQDVADAAGAHLAEGDFDGIGLGHGQLYLGTMHLGTIVADAIAGIL